MIGRYQKDKHSDDHGRTRAGRARDRVRGADEDHGTPTSAGRGRQAERRAVRTQTVRVGVFGGEKIVDDRRSSGDLRDRWRR